MSNISEVYRTWLHSLSTHSALARQLNFERFSPLVLLMMICILFSERASCWGAEKHCSGATGVSFTHNKWPLILLILLILLNIKVLPNSPSHFSPKSPSHFFLNSPSHFFLTRSGSLFSFSISFSLFLPKTPREIMVQALQALWCSCFACLLFWWTENVC